MQLDILCSGDYMDSYESRLLAEGVEVYNMHGLLLAVKCWADSEDGRRTLDLFRDYVLLYLNGELIGSYRRGVVTIDAPVKFDTDNPYRYWYTNGRAAWEFPVDLCLNYGINPRTVRAVRC